VVTLRGLDKAYPFFLEVVKNTQQKNQ
jgi:hypothetical protein